MFWSLLRESTILSGFITVICISVLCYLAVTGQPIPEVLVNICLTIVGFFFGSKVGRREGQSS